MKTKALFFLAFYILLTLNPAVAKSIKSFAYTSSSMQNKKLIYVLKDKKGNILGNVYMEDFKNNIFNKLIITKQVKGITDTLYFIDHCLFKNPMGIDNEYDKKTFNGYKIEVIKNDLIQLFGVGKGLNGASDPVVIQWNYKKKMFQVLQPL